MTHEISLPDDSSAAARYRALVPELFAPVDAPPEHSEALVIGSGFGGAISAYRLASAGVSTSVLERGLRWPNDPWREIFASEIRPDGRAVWLNRTCPLLPGTTLDYFCGVLEVEKHGNITIFRAAAVGGGSVVFTGVMIEPQRKLFEHLFGDKVSYDEMHEIYYPKARGMLNLHPIPTDVYQSAPFYHSRIWDDQVRSAGYPPQPVDSIFNWDVVRGELRHQSRPSAVIGESNFGNSNGSKFDLNHNYLKFAEATGKAKVYPGHNVTRIAQEATGRYVISVTRLSPPGDQLERRELTADKVFLAAGSMGTSELLVRARATCSLPHLNEAIGKGWGGNGDAFTARPQHPSRLGFAQASPCASMIFDERALPVTFENWYSLGMHVDPNMAYSLAMVFEPTRGEFTYNSKTDRADLSWPQSGTDAINAVALELSAKIADRSDGSPLGVAVGSPEVPAMASHPLGGAVLGQATDNYGRVHGHPGLYVMDGAAVPGSAGAANPSLTIAAFAERNIENIIKHD